MTEQVPEIDTDLAFDVGDLDIEGSCVGPLDDEELGRVLEALLLVVWKRWLRQPSSPQTASVDGCRVSPTN